MLSEKQIRELLIASCHSSDEAKRSIEENLDNADFQKQLIEIAIDESDYGGDSPMEAAYYVSRLAPSVLTPYESKLLEALGYVNGYAGHIALALGKMKSEKAKPVILEQLGDGSRFDAWLFKEALDCYHSPK